MKQRTDEEINIDWFCIVFKVLLHPSRIKSVPFHIFHSEFRVKVFCTIRIFAQMHFSFITTTKEIPDDVRNSSPLRYQFIYLLQHCSQYNGTILNVRNVKMGLAFFQFWFFLSMNVIVVTAAKQSTTFKAFRTYFIHIHQHDHRELSLKSRGNTKWTGNFPEHLPTYTSFPIDNFGIFLELDYSFLTSIS